LKKKRPHLCNTTCLLKQSPRRCSLVEDKKRTGGGGEIIQRQPVQRQKGGAEKKERNLGGVPNKERILMTLTQRLF